MIYIYKNQNITNSQFTDDNGIQYPSNWCMNSSQEERDALGVCELTEVRSALSAGERYDGTFTDTVKGLSITRTYNIVAMNLQEIEGEFSASIQNLLDTKAQEKGYDSIFTVCTYENDPNPIFASDATSFKNWRSAVWSYYINVMADVQAGKRAMPSAQDLILELPVL